jgi:fructose-1-phosphate kinase PfkB-like protein
MPFLREKLSTEATPIYSTNRNHTTKGTDSGFGGLVVSMLASGSNPAEAVGFFGRKNPQHAFLRWGSKAVCPMSQLCGM